MIDLNVVSSQMAWKVINLDEKYFFYLEILGTFLIKYIFIIYFEVNNW